MSQTVSRSPLSLSFEGPDDLVKLSERQMVELAACGGRIEVLGTHYRVAPMRQTTLLPRVYIGSTLIENKTSLALTARLHERLTDLGQAQKNKTLRAAQQQAEAMAKETGPAVALYGFRHWRQQNKERHIGLFPNVSTYYMNYLNGCLGISAAAGKGDMDAVLNIISGPLQYEESCIEAQWHLFLRRHFDKLDIFSEIAHRANNGMKPDSAWLSGFAFKNLHKPGRDTYFENANNAASHIAYSQAFAARNTPDEILPELEDCFKKMACTALIRRLCKFGLDFFHEQNIPVVFHWTDHHGRPFSVDDPNPGIDWRNVPGINDLYKCITLSEMHHAQKADLPVFKVYG